MVLTPEDNARLTRLGPGTECGEYFRRFWHPIACVSELKDFPFKVRILGEDLVLYRDGRGKLGLLGLHCAHRSASLEFGSCEIDGLRCRYHGWLYNEKGECLEMPAEPMESTFKNHVRQRAYPVKELGGLIFAYMGPGEPPELPRYDSLVRTDGIRIVERGSFHTHNVIQTIENVMDPWHTFFTHKTMPVWSNLKPEKVIWEKTEFGVHSITYRPFPRGHAKHVRETHFVLPNKSKIGLRERSSPDKVSFDRPAGELLAWAVPLDDYNFQHFYAFFIPNNGPNPDDVTFFSPKGKQYWPPRRDSEGRPIMDDVLSEDIYTQTSQGLVTPREDEHLASSDRGITLIRSLLFEGIEDVKKGRDPIGVYRRPRDLIPIPIQDRLIETEEIPA